MRCGLLRQLRVLTRLPCNWSKPWRRAQVAPISQGRLGAEQRLAALARAGGPLRRVIAALAGRLVERKAWQRLGYARLFDYARERLGRSARQFQELARVGRQLAPVDSSQQRISFSFDVIPV